MDARKHRAKTDSRLYLIDSDPPNGFFQILGTTGKTYHVTFSFEKKKWKCTCPDYTNRHVKCKHVYFVIYRVLHLSDENNIVYDQIILRLQAKQQEEQKQKQEQQLGNENEECPICFDALYSEKIYKCTTCLKDIHHTCILKWRQISTKSLGNYGGCPLCRSH